MIKKFGQADIEIVPNDADARTRLNSILPQDYLAYIQQNNGFDGMIQNEYVSLWKFENLEENNKGYGVEETAPGLFLFGSNGGGEALGFDLRTDEKRIVLVPFIPLRWEDAIVVGTDFTDFLHRLENGKTFLG